MLLDINYIRLEQLEQYELNPIPAASNAIRAPINTIECTSLSVDFFELQNVLDAMSSSATWKKLKMQYSHEYNHLKQPWINW